MQQRRAYWDMKVTQYCNSFSGSIPPNFEHNFVRRHRQTFGKIATIVLLDIDETYHRVLMTAELS